MKMHALMANVLVLLATTAFGADKDVEQLLAKMRETYSGTRTARMVVKTTGSRFGKDPITTELTYMKERKIYAKLSGQSSLPGRSRVFISDGKKVSIDDLSGNVQQSEFDLDFIPMPINLEAMSFWDWKRQLSTAEGANMHDSRFRLRKDVSWNGKSWLVLEETAYGQNVYAEYYIDSKTSLIHRVLVYALKDDKKGKLNLETVVTKLERNIRVDSKLFKVNSKTTTTFRKKIEQKIDF
jgi:outer membrane lipoprotein-sorting protein